jgi:hypothetical protein
MGTALQHGNILYLQNVLMYRDNLRYNGEMSQTVRSRRNQCANFIPTYKVWSKTIETTYESQGTAMHRNGKLSPFKAHIHVIHCSCQCCKKLVSPQSFHTKSHIWATNSLLPLVKHIRFGYSQPFLKDHPSSPVVSTNAIGSTNNIFQSQPLQSSYKT